MRPRTLALRATRAAGLITSLIATARLTAQEAPAPARRWELRVPSGALIGTGGQRENIKDARLTAVQLSWLLQPRLALVGTFGWARSRDLAGGNMEKVDVFASAHRPGVVGHAE